MKLSVLPKRVLRSAILCAAAAAVFTAAASSVRAQAYLSFSGGNGTPLSLTLNSTVTYLVTANPTFSAPEFVFQGTAIALTGGQAGSGTITAAINNGTPQSVFRLTTGVTVGVVQPQDSIIFGSRPGVSIGDVVTLNAGTLTTVANYAGAPPASGAFSTFLIDQNGEQLSGGGLAVAPAAPEPSAGTLLGVAGGVCVMLLRRRGRTGTA